MTTLKKKKRIIEMINYYELFIPLILDEKHKLDVYIQLINEIKKVMNEDVK